MRNRVVCLWCVLSVLISAFVVDSAGQATAVSPVQAPVVTEAERKSIVAATEALQPADIPVLLPKAEAGDASAQYMLGVAYADSKAVQKDPAQAWLWFQRSAEKGWPVGQNAVGTAYKSGMGVSRNEVEAVRWYRKAADQGYAQAQANLGVAYYEGLGVPQDATEAVKWFRQAAEQENAFGQLWLGISYAEGHGVAGDMGQALIWFRKAAGQGEAKAEYNVGRIYDNGLGVSQDHSEAATWYRKAADHGNADAQFDLAMAYHNGEGVHKDREEAAKWLGKASDQGSGRASTLLGEMYWNGELGRAPIKRHIAMHEFEKGAKQGYPVAPLTLGEIYFKGWEFDRDYIKACTWFLIADDLDKAQTWGQTHPSDIAQLRKTLPSRISKTQEKLTPQQFAECQRQAAEWASANSPKLSK